MLDSRGLGIWSMVLGPERKYLIDIIFQPVLPPFPIYDLYPSNSDICPRHHSFFSYIFASFSSFAFLLISPCSYKPPHMGFCPCSSLFCFQVGLHSSPPGHLAAWREDTRVTGGASILLCSTVSFTISVILYPMLPHSLATRKLQESPLSPGIGAEPWGWHVPCAAHTEELCKGRMKLNTDSISGRIAAEQWAATSGFGSWSQQDCCKGPTRYSWWLLKGTKDLAKN